MALQPSSDPAAAMRRLLARWPREAHVWRGMGRSAPGLARLPSEGFLGYGLLRKVGVREDHRQLDPPVYSAIYVLNGRGTYTDARGRSWPLAPGSVFHRIPGHRHTTELDPASGWCELYLALGPRLSHALIDAGLIDPLRPVVERGLDARLAERALAGMGRLRAASDAELGLELGRLLALLAELLTTGTGVGAGAGGDRDARLVADACARLGADLDRPLSPRLVARELGCGYERFRKAFQRATGLPPARWRMRRRIDRARELLFEPDVSVGEVARAVGFADPFLFSNRFRAHTGLSPRRFRRGEPSG